MAYVTEETISKARANLKILNKQYGMKTTLSGKNSTTMNLTIGAGKIDFITNYCENTKAKIIQHDTAWVIDSVTKKQNISVNHYYLDSSFSGIALEYMQKAKDILFADHWDKSDIMTDYFNCAYYINVRVGKWNKPYKFLDQK